MMPMTTMATMALKRQLVTFLMTKKPTTIAASIKM